MFARLFQELHESFKPEEIVETSNGFSQPSAKNVCGGKSRNDFNTTNTDGN
jgi:hypothetical protein